MPKPGPSAPSETPLGEIRREAQRSIFRARNGIKLLTRSSPPQVGATPHRVVWRRGKARLLHYTSDQTTGRPPLLIVFSIVSRAYIFDLRPGHSFVENMLDAGFDVFMLDWGEADAVDSHNDFELYVDNYMPRAFERVLEVAEADEVDVVGYCFGGMLTLLAAAGHSELPIRNLVTMATPIDLSHLEGMITALERGQLEVADVLDETGNVSAESVYRGFSSLRPTADIFKYATLWEKLWNDDFVEGYQAMAGWIGDQVPLPGAIACEMAELLLRRNVLATGEFPIGNRTVRLADITCPLLNVMAEHDHMVLPAASEGLGALVGSDDVTQRLIPAGHIGLIAGRDAARITIPNVVDWLNARDP
jgi:polyhydroxyalkanoate synthase subunit PhaC